MNIHLHQKLLHPLCSWPGHGSGWDREAAFLGSGSNVRLHTGSAFPLACDYFIKQHENYGTILDAYIYQPRIMSVLAALYKTLRKLQLSRAYQIKQKRVMSS
jgi:hypothetical protein